MLSDEQLKERFATLAPAVQDFVNGQTVESCVEAIGQDFSLEGKEFELRKGMLAMLAGGMIAEDFVEYAVKELEVSRDIAEGIVGKMHDLFRNSLDEEEVFVYGEGTVTVSTQEVALGGEEKVNIRDVDVVAPFRSSDAAFGNVGCMLFLILVGVLSALTIVSLSIPHVLFGIVGLVLSVVGIRWVIHWKDWNVVISMKGQTQPRSIGHQSKLSAHRLAHAILSAKMLVGHIDEMGSLQSDVG